MNSKYLSTNLATDWEHGKDWALKVIETILFFVPKANPGYEPHMHLIDRWVVEFDGDDNPGREIGLSTSDEVVVAGPSARDYGFWCDTNMTFKDFQGETISESEFEAYWERSSKFRSPTHD